MKRRRQNAGFTLVELMVVVAIIGVLAALAVYGVAKYLAAAKTGEAKNTVGAVARTATAIYEGEVLKPEVLPEGTVSQESGHALCGTALPVPLNMSGVSARKYQPSAAPGIDFGSGDQLNGWSCLVFAIANPVYYQYHYYRDAGYLSPLRNGPDPGGEGFEASAQGDVDGDGTYSLFARVGTVIDGQYLKTASQVFIADEFE